MAACSMNKPSHLNWIELSQDALNKNILSLSKLAGNSTLTVCVKANAYGHGLSEIVAMLSERPEVDGLTVHSLEEAAQSRQAGWKRGLMLLGPFDTSQAEEIFHLDVEPTIFDKEQLEQLGQLSDKLNSNLKTHLKLETGTNRQGIRSNELSAFASIYQKYERLARPYGASMHFANIEDTTDHSYAQQQLGEFNEMLKKMENLGIAPTVRHTASSAALILLESTHFDLVRPGISVYGYWPSKETYLSYRHSGGDNDIFRPVLSWKTRITQLKVVPADSFIGYGCSYRTGSEAKLAVIPIGYYDGFGRNLSNLAYVLVKGKRAPVRGRVCMNLTMIDISDIPGVKVGDEVTIIGQSGSEVLTAKQLASWGESISYEVLARLSAATPRLAVD